MKIRAAWSAGTVLCLAAALVSAAVLGGYRDVPLGTQALDVCTTDTAHPSSGEMNAVESLIRSRLSTELNLPHASVQRRSESCFRILLPATSDTGRVADGVTRPGYMALADSGSTTLQPGRRVTLVCSSHLPDCIPGGKSGQTNLRARPYPVLQVVIPPGSMQPGGAEVADDSTGKPAVQYALTSGGAARWCSYTTHHVRVNSAIVIDGRVVSDPQIVQKICGGLTQITGIGSRAEALRIAAYINFGSYAGSRHFLEVSRNGQPVPVRPRQTTEAKICSPNSLPAVTPECYTPEQLRTAYAVSPLLHRGVTGEGRTIVIIGAQSTSVASGQTTIDLHASLHRFDRMFGLPNARLSIISPFGGRLTRNGAGSEAVLDIEMAHTMAPGADLVVIVPPVGRDAPRTVRADFRPPIRAIRYAVQRDVGDIISISLGIGESCMSKGTRQALHSLLQQARSRHISVVADSGDSGSVTPVCSLSSQHVSRSVLLPAADPLVTAVGGTTLHADVASGTYVDETVWNRTTDLNPKSPARREEFTTATGGGFSRIYGRPSFQKGIRASGSERGIPDVAFDADMHTGMPVVAVEHSHTFIERAGGTSLGVPAWAGIVALADQYAHRRLGFLNDAIYRIGASKQYARAFHDILRGNNTFASTGPKHFRVHLTGFSARPGWDAVTGWGTPNVTTLVPLLGEYVRTGDGKGL